MPTRLIREGWLESLRVDSLTAESERFYFRLMLKADDFGRYHGDPRILRSHLFPLKVDIRKTDIPRWLVECEKAGLLRSYQDSQGRAVVEILRFNQRTRAKDSKFEPMPDECGAKSGQPPDGGQTDDGHMTDTCQADDGQLLAYTETETEAYSKTETSREARKPRAGPTAERPTQAEVVDYCKGLGLTGDDGQYIFLNWEDNDWKNTKTKKSIRDWKRTIQKWKAGSYFPSQKSGHSTHQAKEKEGTYRMSEEAKASLVRRPANSSAGS